MGNENRPTAGHALQVGKGGSTGLWQGKGGTVGAGHANGGKCQGPACGNGKTVALEGFPRVSFPQKKRT